MKRVVLVRCLDAKGLVYKISKIFFKNELNILKQDEFVDSASGVFFLRTELIGDCDYQKLKCDIQAQLDTLAYVDIIDHSVRKKVLLFATKESHCLGDILIRYDSGELNADILGVVSNRDSLASLTARFGLPFWHIMANEDVPRQEHEDLILNLIKRLSHQPDILVLAKYMRILTPYFVSNFENKIINIHHSFLPAFIGANPYKQAYERGVKIIGATAHFVNNNLDEGPIIAQGVVPVDHSLDANALRSLGKNVEKATLSKALDLALEDRIFVESNKTVIF
jgi:formyltetrahydrofolate deformylase